MGKLSNHIIHISNGKLAEDTPISKVDEIVEAAVAKKNIVIHMHGGLVDEAAGRETARRLTDLYKDAGAYPIFMVWEAGLFEVLRNNFRELASEAFFRLILKRVRRIVAQKAAQDENTRSSNSLPPVDLFSQENKLDAALDKVANGVADDLEFAANDTVADGTTQISPIEEIALENELAADFLLKTEIDAISAGLRDRAEIEQEQAARSARPVMASSKTLMDPEAIERLIERPEGDLAARGLISSAKAIKAIISISKNVISRWLDGRFHGLHATIVEEIVRELYLANVGALVWGHMKRDTADSFGGNADVFGGTALLNKLNDKIGLAEDVRITLVGHSTGAVFIAHMLEKAQQLRPSGFNFNIVFLAPASTFKLTARSFLQYKEQIAGFRMFTMTDQK